jgi:hypothetical protein
VGGGHWDATSYSTTRATRKATGADPFAYTSQGLSSGKVHDDLDPAKLNSFDAITRECFDSDDHPFTTPIAIMFDVTGSMGGIPRQLQDKLTNLFGLLLRKGYCEDPQILVGGVGDSRTDRFPIQISQFEADNRIDTALENIILEGNGGGQGLEGYELAFWAMGALPNLDSVTKRGKKGYLFVIGDEMSYTDVRPSDVKSRIGLDISEPVSLIDAINAAQENFEVFWIYPSQASYYRAGNHEKWRDIFAKTNQGLGERVIVVDDIDNVCEVIGSTIGIMEGAVDDLDDVAADLDSIGAGSAKGTVSKALANLTPKGAVTTSASPSDLSGAGASRI